MLSSPLGSGDGALEFVQRADIVEGLICFLAVEPDGFAVLPAVDNGRINEAPASRAAAAVSVFFVPDEAISPVVVAVLDPGASGYGWLEDVATLEIC